MNISFYVACSDARDCWLQYLLSDQEIQVKTALWMAENADYLKEQKGRMHLPPALCPVDDVV